MNCKHYSISHENKKKVIHKLDCPVNTKDKNNEKSRLCNKDIAICTFSNQDIEDLYHIVIKSPTYQPFKKLFIHIMRSITAQIKLSRIYKIKY